MTISVSSLWRRAWLLLVVAAASGCVSVGRVVVEWDTCAATAGEVCNVESDE